MFAKQKMNKLFAKKKNKRIHYLREQGDLKHSDVL
jgi:hypothetical protein